MAWFTFTDASNETFVIRLTDPDQIAHARDLIAGRTESDPRIGGVVVKTEAGYNIGWSYHLADVFFFELSFEGGSSTMRYIEEHLAEVGGHLLPGSIWTGWSSELVEELQEQSGGACRDVLVGSRNADILFGRGGDDVLRGRTGADHIVGGAGDDRAFGGLGDDKLGGGRGADRLSGGAGSDVLVGGLGSDQLSGGLGDDTLTGGAGADTLRGGGGADRFVFKRLGDGADTIEDFGRGADLLVFESSAFGRLAAVTAARFVENASGAAETAAHRFVFETDTGILRFDPDGSGAKAAVIVATLNVDHLTIQDFLLI